MYPLGRRFDARREQNLWLCLLDQSLSVNSILIAVYVVHVICSVGLPSAHPNGSGCGFPHKKNHNILTCKNREDLCLGMVIGRYGSTLTKTNPNPILFFKTNPEPNRNMKFKKPNPNHWFSVRYEPKSRNIKKNISLFCSKLMIYSIITSILQIYNMHD